MKRTTIAIVGMTLVLAGIADAAAASRPPGEPEGFICSVNPGGSPPPFSCSYIATVDGMYINNGLWTLVIKRGCKPNGKKCKKTITIDSPSDPVGFAYALPGVILPGDRVVGTLKAMGTTMAVGSLTGIFAPEG